MMEIQKPLVLGIGRVGSLVATLLTDLNMDVTGVDKERNPFVPDHINFVSLDVTDSTRLAKTFEGRDAVISCLPYHLMEYAAVAAHQAGIHYFDCTEDVETTQVIRQLAETARGVMISNNGLAPGLICILGAHLANWFDEGTLRYIKLRVGALPQHPIGQLGYAGNWSLEGLIHEYIAKCDVILGGIRQKVAALKDPEILRIDGIEHEAFTTSGGLGTMTETYEGKVETLDYKSIRYPGHLAGMKLLVEELRFKDTPDALVEYIRNALPPDEQDRVLIHVSVQGEIDGKLQTKVLVTDYKPIEINGALQPAIAWTTATAIVGVVELVNTGELPQKGFVKQEDIPLPLFLRTQTGKYFVKHQPDLAKYIYQ